MGDARSKPADRSELLRMDYLFLHLFYFRHILYKTYKTVQFAVIAFDGCGGYLKILVFLAEKVRDYDCIDAIAGVSIRQVRTPADLLTRLADYFHTGHVFYHLVGPLDFAF